MPTSFSSIPLKTLGEARDALHSGLCLVLSLICMINCREDTAVVFSRKNLEVKERGRRRH